jgi:hypothetical protein
MFTINRRKITTSVLIILASIQLSGCFATKIVTVPMRVGGAIVSVVPVVGNVADDAIDVAADTVDLIPL